MKQLKLYALLTPVALMAPSALFADVTSDKLCEGANFGSGNSCIDGHAAKSDSVLQGKVGEIVNILLYVAAAIAVLIIIVGGIRYITSTGDATRIKQAKDTILYAIIGLIVAIVAYAIVNFVITQLGG